MTASAMKIGWVGFHEEGLLPLRTLLERGVEIEGVITLTPAEAAKRSGAADYSGLCREFCVPLLEAMGFSLPVLARARPAIPETLGPGGLLLPEDGDPLLVAEAVAEVLENDRLRADLVSRGQARLGDFDPDAARARLLDNLLSVI